MSLNQEDTIGAWSEDKLELLRKYLEAYVTIMRGQSWCRNGYHYVDAFAGTSRPMARDEGEARYIDGSPRVALTIKYPFSSYTFIELEPRRVERLQELRIEFSELDIRISQGDCNEIITNNIVTRIRYENFNRGFVFLDPFAMNLVWSTIQQIADTKALEVFINVPIMAMNRTGLPNDPEHLTPAQIERNNSFWGSEDWRNEIYEVRPTLFGPREYKIQPTTAQRLSTLYKDRLTQVFPYVTDPLVMRNSTGQPIYCLIFAGHNKTGADITRTIFKKYERLSG
jgi:three-Cys-motif partner protein